ncbi:NEFA interacting nuclear protein NIP30 N terminal [Echinococcus multilocularis]|uniref:NEFA interacting nuclear protein NIP30 N terminal n=1 Tax=Echinococcus multilocularis TaxID=6211 RepID=A0A068Y3W8_ECHMU|nr:NEFA interacting nuclear protein NIP30 N terminal [Echinococcus multilocularis]
MSSSLPRFISEKEIAERKLRDAAEGKKEEPYDPRPLYDRLQAERARQQEEYEASTAFKNQIHRLDPDEAAFLAKIDRERCLLQESVDQEAEQLIQEAKISSSLSCLSTYHKTFLTSDYAATRSSLMKISVSSSSNAEVSVRRPPIPSSSTPLNQRSLLAGIKRKSSQMQKIDAKKSHLDGANNDLESSPSDATTGLTKSQDELANNVEPQLSSPNNDLQNPLNVSPNVAQATPTPVCLLAGVLPGLEAYGDSDESSDNSDRDSSSGVEDAAVILSSIALLRGKQTHEPNVGE